MAEFVIHKQKLPIFTSSEDLVIFAPYGARVLKISRQFPTDQTPYVWYACDPQQPDEAMLIHVFGTGQHVPVALLDGYLGTEIFHNGQLVLHFFRPPSKPSGSSE
ncbi:hypothetical protein [Shinella zoogloeoides]|uniref:DUF7352 domain-containing protein n=1 Tax=Shinella zoogloeoides TaxID=352475 RepID=UPI00299D3F8D|nr:hypothetical protein [Shinella zoogloeoides]WPE19845.1 hypothetical protein ShzoTeo12_10210 [Shinella zoogloeoides]